jgi:hypothetical protein
VQKSVGAERSAKAVIRAGLTETTAAPAKVPVPPFD